MYDDKSSSGVGLSRDLLSLLLERIEEVQLRVFSLLLSLHYPTAMKEEEDKDYKKTWK